MSDSWKELVRIASEEVAATCRDLPENLKAHAAAVPVRYQSYPDDALIAEGWDPDLLGLYTGDPVGIGDAESSGVPREIRLFLDNLWDYADGEEEIYREEVRITFLHEFGHYLGLDEDGMEERGLL